MGWNDHIDNDLYELLKELVSAGFVFEGGAPFDVANKVIGSGKSSLTPAEANIFDEQLLPALRALEASKLDDDVEDALKPPAPDPS
jgi:hypothetical protein